MNAEHVGVHNEKIKVAWEDRNVARTDFGGRGLDVLLVHGNGHNSAARESKD